eukprot:TCONS_00064454-protein
MMKTKGLSHHSHSRFTPLYHPYYQTPVYNNMKTCSAGYMDTTPMPFNNFSASTSFYESESEESFPGSPFSNTGEQSFEGDLSTIDFSDLLNIQKHEQDDQNQTNQLQQILEQVSREALQPLDPVDISYSYNLSTTHTPPCFRAVSHDSYPSPNYQPREEQPYPSPTYNHREEPFPSPNFHQMQPPVPSPPSPPRNIKTFEIKVESGKPDPPQKRRSSSEDSNDKIRLYEFVLQLLNEERADCIRWLCPIEGEFEITNSAKIAQLWGEVKKNPTMTYEKFARALRHYYKLGILINYKHKEKLRYKFSQDILQKNKRTDA